MIIFPAIDIKDGRCVRLAQGDYDRVTEFSDDPVAVARTWQQAGAEWVHVVDLDGAKSGVRANGELIERIRAAINVRLQVGGGLRSIDSLAELLDNGVDRAILGTVALNDPVLVTQALQRWPGQIAISLDTRDGLVRADGWLTSSQQTPQEVLRRLNELGASTFIYTDIARDSMLAGPNLEALSALLIQAHESDAELIAAGGVSSVEDLLNLARLGVDGAIVGRAIYTGNVDLASAISAVQNGGKS